MTVPGGPTNTSRYGVADSLDVPALSPVHKRVSTYPVEVDAPGELRPHSSATPPAASERTSVASSQPRRYRRGHIVGAVIGIALVVITVVAFVWLVNFATTSLPQHMGAPATNAQDASGYHVRA